MAPVVPSLFATFFGAVFDTFFNEATPIFVITTNRILIGIWCTKGPFFVLFWHTFANFTNVTSTIIFAKQCTKFFKSYKPQIQRSVRLVPQSGTFDIVSRCFENKNNTCWETKLYKNAICLLFTSLQIHFWQLCSLDVLAAGLPDYGFVNL